MINFCSEAEANAGFLKLQSIAHAFPGGHPIKITKELASIKEKNDSDQSGSDPNSENNHNSCSLSKED